MKRITEEPLIFPIGDKDYQVPPVSVAAGFELAELHADPKKQKSATSERLFQLALGTSYDDMVADGVSVHLVFRAGMAANAHFMALNSGGSFEDALTAAEGVWESGVDPKALAEWAAKQPPKTRGHRTAAAGASTASTSGTSTRKASTRSTRPRASRSPRSSAKPK